MGDAGSFLVECFVQVAHTNCFYNAFDIGSMPALFSESDSQALIIGNRIESLQIFVIGLHILDEFVCDFLAVIDEVICLFWMLNEENCPRDKLKQISAHSHGTKAVITSGETADRIP